MGKDKYKKLRNKALLIGMIASVVSVDTVPLFSYAKDFQYVGEDITTGNLEEGVDAPESTDITDDNEIKVNDIKEDVAPIEETETLPEIDTTPLTEEKLEGTVEGVTEPETTKEEVPVRKTQMREMDVQEKSENNYVLATDEDFSGTSNGNFKYIGTDDYVEIPHTIKGVNVTSYTGMFNEKNVKGVKSTNKNVTNMTIMFMDFQGETLDISQLDTSSVVSMSSMFWGTTHGQTRLRTLKGLETLDTSKVQNMYRVFYRTNLTEIDVSNFNTSNVVTMSGMFEDSLATDLDLSGFDTSKVTDMSRMFYVARVENLDVSSFNTSKVLDMSLMFQDVFSSTIKGLDGFDTSNVRNMSTMFKNTRVEDLNISKFNTSSVSNMEGMFSNASDTNLDLRNFDTTNVTTMKSMFENSKAKNIDLSSFNTANVKTMNSMFSGSRAEELDLSRFNTSKVTDMIYMFKDSSATAIDLSSFDTRNVTKMTQMFTNSGALTLDLSGFTTLNVTDMGEMFKDSKANVLDLSSFNTTRLTNMSNFFSGSSATEINVSTFDTTYVTNMDSMFKNTKVKELDLSSFDMSSVNDTEGMFENTTISKATARASVDAEKLNKSGNKPVGLTFNTLYVLARDEDFSGFYNGIFKYIGDDEYVEIPSKIKGTNVTSYKGLFENSKVQGVVSTNTSVLDMSNMFKGNVATKLDVSSIDTSGVTDMSGMLQDTKATKLDVTGYITEKTVNMSNMFRGTKVNELDLGSFDMSNVVNTSNMFQNTVATVGYARTQEDLTKLKGSSNKPENLQFTIWGILTKQGTEEWTNKPVEIGINAMSDKVGISYVEMVNETGRNYILNSEKFNDLNTNNGASHPISKGYDDKVGANWIYGRYKDTGVYSLSTYVAQTYASGRGTYYSEDLYPVPEDGLVYSVAVMSSEPMTVGMRGGNTVKLKPNEWTRIYSTGSGYSGRPNGVDVGNQTNIPLGTRLYYKEYKIEKANESDLLWKPAPEDSESSSGQEDTFKVYANGTYIFRATDSEGNTKAVSHRVTNIDTTQPSAELKKSHEGWTSQDVKIYVDAKDDLSGVDYITLPNGNKVTGNKTEYPVSVNGTYEFKVTDKAGNVTTYAEKVTNIDKTITQLNTSIGDTKWTNGTVGISVESGTSTSGLTGIELVNSPIEGRNLLTNAEEIKQATFSGWQHYFPDVKVSEIGLDRIRKGGNFKLKGYLDNIEGNEDVGLMLHIPKTNNGYLQYTLSNTNQEPMKPRSKGFVSMNINIEENTDTTGGFMAIRHTSINAKTTTATMSKVKLEVGKDGTPWTPAPEDVKLENNKKVYPVASNGIYTYKSTYNNGTTSEASVNVTNIDRTKPEVTITGNVEDWVEEDSLTLTINAKDTQSGVKSIKLPDGKVVNGNKSTFEVTKNGDYTFEVTDNVGNTTVHKEKVEYLMIEYLFYIYDTKGKPVIGAEFELMRNNEYYKTTVSDSTGLVSFGMIPPDGKYQVRQVTAPGGVIVDPEDIESGDVTEPIEVVTYPRETILPGTGKLDTPILLGLAGILLAVIGYVVKKKKVLE